MEQAVIKLDNQLCILTYRDSKNTKDYGLGYALDYVVNSWNTFIEEDNGSEFDFERLIKILDIDFDTSLECGFNIIDIDEELKMPFPKAR
jgi:hypothetical protein